MANPFNHSINLIWLNRQLDPDQPLIFKEHYGEDHEDHGFGNKPTADYTKVLDAALGWCTECPNAQVTIWYDSEVTTQQQVDNTIARFQDMAADPNASIQLQDIRTLSIVQANPDIFSQDMGLYFKIDLLKLILPYYDISERAFDYSVVTDLGVEPMPESQLLSEEYVSRLTDHGVLTSGKENGFIQVMNTDAMVKSLALIINANLQRCWQGLHAGDNALRKKLLDNLFRAVYNDTKTALHFFSQGFTHGTIYFNDDDKEQIAFDPAQDGHHVLGNYFCTNGCYNVYWSQGSEIHDVTEFYEAFRENGDFAANDFSFTASFARTLCGKVIEMPDKEYTLVRHFMKQNCVFTGRRDDVDLFGRDHHDPISDELEVSQRSLALLPYQRPQAQAEVEPIVTTPESYLFKRRATLIKGLSQAVTTLESCCREAASTTDTSLAESITAMRDALSDFENNTIDRTELRHTFNTAIEHIQAHPNAYQWQATLDKVLFYLVSILSLGTANLISKRVNGRYTFFDKPSAFLPQSETVHQTADTLAECRVAQAGLL